MEKTRLQLFTGNSHNTLHIIGQNRFLNELLANSFLKEDSLNCQKPEDDTVLPADLDGRESVCLHLVDAQKFVPGEHWSEVYHCSDRSADQCYYAFFNVDPGAGIEAEAMRKGVRGFFYSSDSLDMVCKGVRKIISGDIWFSRETLLNCVLQEPPQPERNGVVDGVAKLTTREQEILRCLSGGATNQEIADEMVVSVHTVKSHLYNLYKKINVPNRFQAMLWAASNGFMSFVLALFLSEVI